MIHLTYPSAIIHSVSSRLLHTSPELDYSSATYSVGCAAMAQPRSPLTVLLFLAAVFSADMTIFARWIHRSNGMDLLSFALATLNILGLALLGRAILFSARVFQAHRRATAPSQFEIDASSD